MRLKQLEIIGFKSFPDKCSIDFPSGISAIVGPNGCGKSNIIDAIKWVMGEQSIKQLRGKSMGDVIFSGTNKRLPLNMAEVSLTLSNDTTNTLDDQLNQLTELMVTRRLFRSGESAYLINKQPCRLKDIHNVFLGSGMGAKSCAIVQQGNIGAITDATPEERRLFIEEAAGVSRYKIRKNEAISKVNSTNQNLLRLNDIIDEIKKQMNNMRRQARKAQRHKDFREREKQSDFLITVHYYDQYSEQIKNAQGLLNDFKEKSSLHSVKLEKLNSVIKKIKSDQLDKDQKVSRIKSEKLDAERTIDHLNNDLKHIRNEEKRLYDEITGLDTAISELEEKNQKMQNEIAEELIKQKKFTVLTKEIREALEKNRLAARDIRNQLNTLQQNLENHKKQLMDLMTQKAKYQNIFKTAESNKENLKQRIFHIQKDEAETKKVVENLKNKELSAKNDLISINEVRESIQQRLSEKKMILDDQSAFLGKQIKTVNSTSNELIKIKSKYAALKKMDDNFEWYKDGVKAIMKKKNSDAENLSSLENDAIAGIVADVIDPEPGYESALEAVLGEALQYIFVKDQQTGIQSINFLKDENAGRGGFIPVGNAKSVVQKLTPTNDALLLNNHISVKAGYEQSVFALLLDVAVVDDVDDALNLCEQSNDFNKIVTKNGDIIFSNGIIVGGSKDKLSGIYEKKKELKQLKKQISKLNENLEVEQNIQNELEATVKNLEVDIQKLTVKKIETEKESLDAERYHYQTAENLKHSLSRLEIITLEIDKLVGEKTDVDTEIEQHDSMLSKISQNERSIELRIKEISAQIASISHQSEKFDHDEMDLKLELTKLNAEHENTAKTLNRLEEFKAEGLLQAAQIKKDITIKTKKRKNSTLQILEQQKQLSATIEGLNNISIKLQSCEIDFQTVVAEIEKTDDTISGTKTEIEEIQTKIHQLELELSSFKIKRENVVNRFLETYSQSFAQVVSENLDIVKSPSFSIKQTEADLSNFRKKIMRIGEVNIGAIDAYEELKTRYDFLVKQHDDLISALDDLQSVIKKINRITQKLFMEMFGNINEKFKSMFPKLFDGGSAWLELTQPNDPLETGIELMIHPPGKKVTRLSLLSGGEKALSAIAFIFSIFLINPASYCLLDEIDAPLDEANTHRFNELLRIIGEKSQIIMISHNKKSMEFSDMLFGVTMRESGVSKIVSVDIEKLSKQAPL